MSEQKPFFEIASYHDYVSPSLAMHLLKAARPVDGVQDLAEVTSEAKPIGTLETTAALKFLVDLYSEIKKDLRDVLAQRTTDRKFIDERVRVCAKFNDEQEIDLLSSDYKTILGLEDSKGRIVAGPLTKDYAARGGKPVATIPEFLKGPHVTLFGPPDSAKLAVNAMNAYHRRIKDEPRIVAEILKNSDVVPMWGADDEDSKTPLHADLVDAAINLTACFDGTIKVEEAQKKYTLAQDHLAIPIKRFPGLAMPCSFLFYKKNPIPLHLYDFALHIFKNWQNEQALVFYVPKLENEEEARYIYKMVATAERIIKTSHPEYKLGSVRLMIVLENPRAILRTHEIMDALHPYFVGASLGWHDYLASMARLFKEDHHYRIPVKADPDIVIKYIKASHLLLADVVGSRGGIKVGGMYGILPLDADPMSPSFQMTLKGFIKDVIIQLKRDLTGFWVAHPDFVRLGIALVEAYKLYYDGRKAPLTNLVKALLHKKYHKEILQYIAAPDIGGLDPKDENYVRSLIVADIKESDFIANNHPDEIRFNVFQSLQYLTDWLSGNGCVALPSTVNGIAVRVMDDLATAERSRWEVWHELHHKRFAIEDFLRIVQEEMLFIRKDFSNSKKIVQVKWSDKTAKWYPVALQIMLQLMTDSKPPEFATELLMPFTVESVRNAEDPWAALLRIDKNKFHLAENISRFNYYFEACGAQRFAEQLAQNAIQDLQKAEDIISTFSIKEINEAASFHGNIGESARTLDHRAKDEQSRVLSEDSKIQNELLALGAKYKKKFGFKFLIAAKNKSGKELLAAIKSRNKNSKTKEIKNAREALSEIAVRRMTSQRLDDLKEKIENLRLQHKINSSVLAVNTHGARAPQELAFGKTSTQTLFEIASLSKSFAAAFAIDYFNKKGIPLTTKVNDLFETTKSAFRVRATKNPKWADAVQIRHLINHTALNMHYVNGVANSKKMPPITDSLKDIEAIAEPGEEFHYSGGGFIVLEHLLEALTKKPIQALTRPFLDRMGLKNITFQQNVKKNCARGHYDSGQEIEGGRFNFAALAAGGLGTAGDVAKFLNTLTTAYHSLAGAKGLTHDVAVEMFHGVDRGSSQFMGAAMGLGVFIADAGDNRLAIHQGANDGFRALFVHCFAGPDCGKGFVILCDADNNGVIFIAQAAQEILKHLNISGINFSKFHSAFNPDNIEQEQVVNQGYKKLIFDAFEPVLPEAIVQRGPVDTLAEYNLAVDAKILSASNQKFARGENLISSHHPAFDPELFGRQGKVMDSWESARHNELEFDQLTFELKKPSEIKYIALSTEFHDGNHPDFVRVFGRENSTQPWQTIFAKSKLQGHSILKVKVNLNGSISQVRVEMAPDGGLTRIGLYKNLPDTEKANYLDQPKSVRFAHKIPKTLKPMVLAFDADAFRSRLKKNIDYASRANGGSLVKATNEHYGPAVQVISPYPAINMFDGLESARSREPGHFEEVILKLGRKIKIKRILFDFKFFVNNNPKQISVAVQVNGEWQDIVDKTNVKAFAGNQKEFILKKALLAQTVRIRTYPDGGINRIKIFAN